MEKEKGLPLDKILSNLNIVSKNHSAGLSKIIGDYIKIVSDFIDNTNKGISTTTEMLKIIDEGTILINLISINNVDFCEFMISEINSPDNYLNISDISKEKNNNYFNEAIKRFKKIRKVLSGSLTNK